MARNPLSPYRSGGLIGGALETPLCRAPRCRTALFDDLFRGTGQMPTSSQREGAEGGMLMPQIDVSERYRLTGPLSFTYVKLSELPRGSSLDVCRTHKFADHVA